MANFRYKAIGADGRLLAGEMEAKDTASVIVQLRAAGHMPIGAEPKSERLDLRGLLRSAEMWRRRIRPTDVTAITRELATLMNAGVPVDASLRVLERHTSQENLKSVLKRIHTDVQSGRSLSAALATHERVFDSLFVSLIRAGEASGSLGSALARLADHREESDGFRAHLVSSLTYPIALLCVAALSLLVLMIFVIPKFIPLFAEAEAPLPLLTEVVFAVAQLFQAYWWVLAALVAIGAVASERWLRKPGNRARVDQWLLKAPIAGEIVLATETVRLTRTLETLLRNGLPLLESLKLVKDVLRNRRVAGTVESAMASVRSGGRLAAALAQNGVLPRLAVELLTIGEESGHLESMLAKTAETFEARIRQKLKRLLTLLEPVLILGLGAVIALVIVSILMAMLGLNELVS